MAANPQIGDVAFEVGGKSYTFRLGTLALAVLENETGQSASRYFARPVDQWGVKDLRDVFVAGMMRHHKTLTENEITDLIVEMGMTKASELIGRALIAANGKEDASGAANPPKAAAIGIGTG